MTLCGVGERHDVPARQHVHEEQDGCTHAFFSKQVYYGLLGDFLGAPQSGPLSLSALGMVQRLRCGGTERK